MCSSEPTNYVNDTIEYTTQTLVIFNSVILEKEFKCNGSGAYKDLDIKFGKSINALKNDGYEKIRIEATYELAEADDCYQTISIHDSSRDLYKKKFSHGGFKAYTSGIFLQNNTKTATFGEYKIDETYDINTIFEDTLYFKVQAENARYRDFYIRNVSVKVTAIKEVIQY